MGNMTETPKQQSNFDKETDIALAIARQAGPAPDAWEQNASEAARRVFDMPETPTTPEGKRRKKGMSTLSRRAIATGVGFGVALSAGYGAHELFKSAEFSEDTTTYTLEMGEGEWAAAGHIEGIDTIDRQEAVAHIKNDPANAGVYADGRLDPGETLTIPKSVKGYEAPEQEDK